METQQRRIIGSYDQGNPGAMLIVFTNMHGNEPAGFFAFEEMLRMLHEEKKKFPDFTFRGKILGLQANMAAFAKGQRFINKDMNRQFTEENIARIFSSDDANLDSEDKEIKALLTTVRTEVEAYQPKKLIFLDLHTTTAYGGIFSIATDDKESQRIAIALHAPVILKMIDGLKGTTLHYFKSENFDGIDTTAITFESGQHNETLSISRAISAITNCLRSIDCVDTDVVEHRHDEILKEYSRGLPKVADLLYCHSINKGDQFEMKEGYSNFQKIAKDEILAHDKNGAITATADGRILMPLYQKQGEDGFFVIQTQTEHGYYE